MDTEPRGTWWLPNGIQWLPFVSAKRDRVTPSHVRDRPTAEGFIEANGCPDVFVKDISVVDQSGVTYGIPAVEFTRVAGPAQRDGKLPYYGESFATEMTCTWAV